MSIMNKHVCSSCGHELPLKALQQRISGFVSALSPHLGVLCPHCNAQLKVNARPAAIFTATTFVFFLLFFFAFEHFTPSSDQKHLSLWQIAGGVPLLLAYNYGAYFSSVSLPLQHDRLLFSTDPLEDIDRRLAPVREKARKESEMEQERIAEINDPTRAQWTCKGCSSDNPATFDMCWKCQRHRK